MSTLRALAMYPWPNLIMSTSLTLIVSIPSCLVWRWATQLGGREELALSETARSGCAPESQFARETPRWRDVHWDDPAQKLF
jgi:hypothetical protein